VATFVGVAIRIGSTVVNCADIETMTEFWSAALGLVPNSRDPDDDFRVLRGQQVNLSLQLAETPVSARDQMHLDLYSDDAAAQVERLLHLGATRVREHHEHSDSYVVMSDPEGNEFCVCSMPSS
jgi:predicted enzyme related to lactoylglutathione lyase